MGNTKGRPVGFGRSGRSDVGVLVAVVFASLSEVLDLSLEVPWVDNFVVVAMVTGVLFNTGACIVTVLTVVIGFFIGTCGTFAAEVTPGGRTTVIHSRAWGS